MPQDGRRELYDELLRLERDARNALAADPRRGPRHEDRRPPTYSRNAAAAAVESLLGRSFHESRIADWLPEEYADFKRPRDFDTLWTLIQVLSQWAGQIPDRGRWNGRWTAAASRRPASRPRNDEAITYAADGHRPLDIVAARMTALAERLRDRHQLGRFTGRAGLIERIDAAIAAQPSGYVVVRGDAGVGKSALAAHLITTRAYPFHVSQASGGSSPESARRNLAAQLITAYALDDLAPGRGFPAEADDPDWLVQVLEAAAEVHRARAVGRAGSGEGAGPLVLVVDGLDEAADAAVPEQTGIPFGLPRPRDLPDGVHVVATSRYGLSTVWAGSGPDRYTDIVVSGEENLADLRHYLQDLVDPDAGDPDLVGRLTTAGVPAARVVDTLAGRSAGVWIYLRYVLDDIRAARLPVTGHDGLNGLPQGLDDYYMQQLVRWQSAPDWATVRLPALATLTALRRPVSVAELASYTGRTAPAEVAALEAWVREGLRAFLDDQDDGCLTRYQVLHQSLRDLFGRDNTGRPLSHNTDPLRFQVRDAHRAAHRAIAHSTLPADLDDLTAWAAIPLGVREEMPEHAALGGLLPELLAHAGFCLSCPAGDIVRHRRYVSDPASQAATNTLELVHKAWTDYPADADRAWWLHVWARRARAEDLARTAGRISQRHPLVCHAFWTGTPHRVLTGHTGGVRAVAAVPLPDGRTLLASGGDDGSVRLWDPVRGNPVGQPLTGHTGGVRAVAAVPLPDGRTLLASGDDGSVRLWDPASGNPVGQPLTGHTTAVAAMAAVPLPDGRTLLATGSYDGSVRLWDPATGNPVGQPLTGHTGGVRAMAAVPLPDGRTLLATGSYDGSVRLWDPSTGTPVDWSLTGHTGGMNMVAAVPLPDGRTLLATGSYDGSVRLWDPATGTPVGQTLTGRPGHTTWVNAMAAAPWPDGRTLIASSWCKEEEKRASEVRLWDPAIGTPVGQTLTGHTGGVLAVAAVPLPDGRTLLATGGEDGSVRLWDPATGTPVGQTPTGHTGGVLAVAAVPLPDGRTLLATGGDEVRLWDPATGTPVGDPLTGHTGGVNAMAAVPLPDGRTLLATGNYWSVRLWDPVRGTPVGQPLTGHTGGMNMVAAVPLPDGRTLLATGSHDGSVRLWDPATGTPIGQTLTGHSGAVAAMALPDGRILLATGSYDGSVRLWDPATGTPVGDPLTGHTGVVRAMAAVPLPDGRTLLATGSHDETVRLWDPATGTPVGQPLIGHTGPVAAVAVVPLPDGRTLLATGSYDETVRLWDPATGTPVGQPLIGHTGPVAAVAAVLLPDGRTLLATGSWDRTVVLWELDLG